MKNEYRVYSANLETLRAKLALLNRKCVKLGVSPIVLTDTGKFEDVEVRNEITGIVTGVRRFVFVELSGESPKFNGWELAAVVEHAEEGNLLRKAPGCKVELSSFRQGAPRCDHCHAIRNRRETYIVVHDAGEQKMVGSNCIKDFLGHKDPHALAALAEICFSAGELCSGSEDADFFGMRGTGAQLVSVDSLLTFAACAIRRLGFVSGKKARESQETGGNISSTAQTASYWMNPGRTAVLGKHYWLPEDNDRDAALKAKQHVLDTLGAKAPESLSDFEHNLLTVCKCEAVEPRNMGILAFVPEYYSRSIEDARQAANEAYFGEIGKRVRNVQLTYIKSTGWDSQYGYTYLHTFSGPNGERILWKSGTNVDGAAGMVSVATFTVKAHEEFKGHKQTKVSRLVFTPPA